MLGPIPKCLFFTVVKNTEILGSVTTNPYFSCHYNINHLPLHVKGKQIPAEVLCLTMDHEKTSVMGYRTLLEASGIHHSISGLQTTNDMNINGYFIFLFDFKKGRAATDGHT